MVIDELRERVYRALKELGKYETTGFSFGNASEIDRERGLVAIKPSGILYPALNSRDIVILSLDGKVIDGAKKPSVDTPTHLEIYRNFLDINGIIHTHSKYATIFAQSRRPIDCYGTTHADYFCGRIPVTRILNKKEIHKDYELNTGKAIVSLFKEIDMSPSSIPACLVANHGPFAFGKNAEDALINSLALERIAEMNLELLCLNPDAELLPEILLEKHFERKHGPKKYYGQ